MPPKYAEYFLYADALVEEKRVSTYTTSPEVFLVLVGFAAVKLTGKQNHQNTIYGD
jgi:hypothetical protein